MRGERGLAVLVAVGLFAVGVGSGSGDMAGPTFPPGVAELLTHAVALWKVNVLKVPAPSGSSVVLHGVVDVNGDGIPDLVVSYEEGVWVLFGDGRGGFETGSWAYFDEGERIPAGYGYFIHPVRGFRVLGGIVQDLDRDGSLDMAVVALPPGRGDPARLYLFTFDRHGTVELAHARDLPLRSAPFAAGEFTGDGHMDLLLQTRDRPAEVLVLPGEAGLRFGSPYSILRTDAQPFLFADFNGSGVPDLGVFDADDVTVYLGNGEGGFLPEPLRFRPSAGPITHCAARDLNGDGLMDLVVLSRDTVHVAVQDSQGFAQIGRYELRIKAQRVILCDVDGNGEADLLLEGLHGQRMAVYAGDGRGGFRGPVGEFALISGDLIPADLTGNGRCDLIQVVYPGLYAIYLNTIPREGETRLPIGGCCLLAVGDLSGNGAPDLVAQGTERLEVLWNNGKGGFVRRPLTRFTETAQMGNLAATEFWTVQNTARGLPAGWLESAAAVADRALYVLRTWPDVGEEDRSERPVSELRRIDVTTGQEHVRVQLSEEAVPLLRCGDFDQDGLRDVVAATKKEVLVLWSKGDVRRYPWEKGEVALFCTGDFHGAGEDALAVVSVGALAELYLVSFADRDMEVGLPLLQFPKEAVPLALSCGDVNMDGLCDPIVLSAVLSAVREGKDAQIKLDGVLLTVALSQEGIVNSRIVDLPADAVPWPFTGLAVGDFTGDGKPDLAFTTIQGSGVFILPGRGDGTFDQALRIPRSIGPLFAADLDGDGEPELVGSSLGLNTHVWILRTGGAR